MAAVMRIPVLLALTWVVSAQDYGEPGTKRTTCPCGWTNQKSDKGDVTNEYPFRVSVVTVNVGYGNEYCGAALLTVRHAVSSAHCTRPTDTNDYDFIFILVGDTRMASSERKSSYAARYLVSKRLEHPEYDHERGLNNIALVITEKPIKMNPGVGPICLPKPDLAKFLVDSGQILKSPGAGKLGEFFPGPGDLMKTDMKVVQLDACGTVSPRQICLTGDRKNFCYVESTIGPLIWMDPESKRYTLAGMTNNRTFESCENGSPFTSTDISSYLTWIQEKIQESVPGLQTCTRLD